MKYLTILSVFFVVCNVVLAIHVRVIEQQSDDDFYLTIDQINYEYTRFHFDVDVDHAALNAEIKDEDGKKLGRPLKTYICNANNDRQKCLIRILANGITDGCTLEEGNYFLKLQYDIDDDACNTFLDVNDGKPVILDLTLGTSDAEVIGTMKYHVS